MSTGTEDKNETKVIQMFGQFINMKDLQSNQNILLVDDQGMSFVKAALRCYVTERTDELVKFRKLLARLPKEVRDYWKDFIQDYEEDAQNLFKFSNRMHKNEFLVNNNSSDPDNTK